MAEHTRWILTLAFLAATGGVACSRADEGLTRQLLEANDKVLACQKELAQTKSQVGGLKRQLAEAIANPSRIELKDPEIIELVASLHGPPQAGSGDVQPSLDPTKASQIILGGAGGMQACYERAMKRNAALQMQAGIRFTLGVTVRPTGSVEGVAVEPSVDKSMTECIRSTVTRWKFPSFQGKAVTVEQKFTLTPKT